MVWSALCPNGPLPARCWTRPGSRACCACGRRYSPGYWSRCCCQRPSAITFLLISGFRSLQASWTMKNDRCTCWVNCSRSKPGSCAFMRAQAHIDWAGRLHGSSVAFREELSRDARRRRAGVVHPIRGVISRPGPEHPALLSRSPAPRPLAAGTAASAPSPVPLQLLPPLAPEVPRALYRWTTVRRSVHHRRSGARLPLRALRYLRRPSNRRRRRPGGRLRSCRSYPRWCCHSHCRLYCRP